MIKLFISVLLSAIIFYGHGAFAQQEQRQKPEVGKPCPDFILTEVDYFSKDKVSVQDFKGKWLILDFWTKTCLSCVESFPKINQLQKEFKDQVEFLLIAKNDEKSNRDIRSMYERLKDHYDLDLTIAYDTLLFNQFGIRGVPHIVIVDPQGIVRDIRNTVDKTFLQGLLAEGHTSEEFLPKEKQIWLPDEDTKDHFLYKSVFGNWDQRFHQIVMPKIDSKIEDGYYKGTGMILRCLYNLAYLGVKDWRMTDFLYGNFSRFPILEIADSSDFQHDFTNGISIYNYFLKIPKAKATKEYMQHAMQKDLQKYFGYEVSVETRKMPYWKLTTISKNAEKKLKTKGASAKIEGDAAGYTLINQSINSLIRVILKYHPSLPALINETNISGNVDVTLNAVMTDFTDLKRALQNLGLSLELHKKEMGVLVIRDKER